MSLLDGQYVCCFTGRSRIAIDVVASAVLGPGAAVKYLSLELRSGF